jgi:hypothetical protein
MRNSCSATSGVFTDGDSIITTPYGSSDRQCARRNPRSTGAPRITTPYAITISIAAGASANGNDNRCGS